MPLIPAVRSLTIAALAMLAVSGCSQGAGTADSASPIASVAAPAGKKWSEVVVATPDGMRMGNPDAPLKVVEFGSFTCSHCAEFSKESAEPLKTQFIDSGRVSYELRPFIRDPLDLTAAAVAICSGPERFFALAENIFASQEELFAGAQANPNAAQNIGALPAADRFPALARAWGLDRFFAARGIPAADLNRCLADTAGLDKRTEVTERSGKQYEISGTPTFLLNGEVIEGVGTWPALRDRLRAAGAR